MSGFPPDRIEAAARVIDPQVFDRLPGHERGRCEDCDENEKLAMAMALNALTAAYPEIASGEAWVAQKDHPACDAYLKDHPA
jgi:hypothetical protein